MGGEPSLPSEPPGSYSRACCSFPLTWRKQSESWWGLAKSPTVISFLRGKEEGRLGSRSQGGEEKPAERYPARAGGVREGRVCAEGREPPAPAGQISLPSRRPCASSWILYEYLAWGTKARRGGLRQVSRG